MLLSFFFLLFITSERFSKHRNVSRVIALVPHSSFYYLVISARDRNTKTSKSKKGAGEVRADVVRERQPPHCHMPRILCRIVKIRHAFLLFHRLKSTRARARVCVRVRTLVTIPLFLWIHRKSFICVIHSHLSSRPSLK